MSKEYFSLFPKTTAAITDNSLSVQFADKTIITNVDVVDIMVKFRLKDAILNQKTQFYPYVWKDNDRPDTVAEKYYGNSKYHWVVLCSNDAFDLTYDFPMPTGLFEEYVFRKYKQVLISLGSLTGTEPDSTQRQAVFTYVTTGIHHYEVDNQYIVDAAYYSTYTGTKRAVTFSDYEFELNEGKRNVQLIDRNLLQTIVSEFETDMSTVQQQQKDIVNG